VRLLLLLCLALGLFAADRAGPYLSAGVGLGNYHDDGRLAQMDTEDAVQYRFSAGAFINAHLSVALEYVQFDAFEGEDAGGTSVRQFFKVLTADASGHYAFFDDQLDLFATFGAGELFWEEKGEVSRSSSAAALLFGAGVGVRPLSWLTLNVGYSYYQFGMEDDARAYAMSLGGMYFECQVQF
jgi:opacity protein-like surface antigen